MRKPNAPLADAVRAVLEEHNLTQRAQRIRTGVSHVTVQGMLNGVVPQMETVVAFAQGFGLDVNEWLELAGYPPITEPLPRVSARLIAQIRDGDPEAVRAGRRIAEEAGMAGPDLTWNGWLVEQLRALVAEFPGVGALPMPVECISAFGGLAEPMTEEDAREMYETTRMLFEEEWRRLHGPPQK